MSVLLILMESGDRKSKMYTKKFKRSRIGSAKKARPKKKSKNNLFLVFSKKVA